MSAAPQVRFSKFQNDWEVVSFSQIYKKAIQKNDLTFGNKDIISVANMYYSPNELITNKEYLKTYNIFLLGDIAFEGHRSADYAFGRFVENTIGNGIVSHVFKVFRPKTEFDLEYWKYFINNEKIMRSRLAVSTKSSTMMKELRDEAFLKQKVFVPSVEEQNCIGNLLKTVENLITYYERTISIYDLLIKSRFVEIVKSAKYSLKTIGEVCINTRVGPFGSALHKSEMVSNGPVFVLGTDNAVDNTFKIYEKRYISEEKYTELERYTVASGDIIITMMGTIGRTAVIPDNCMKSIISSHLSCLTVNQAIVLPEFLQKCMVLDHEVASHLEINKKGTIMSGLNLKIIKSIPFTCPPIEIQNEFMNFVKQVDKSKFVAEQSLSRYQALFEALSEILFVNNPRQDN